MSTTQSTAKQDLRQAVSDLLFEQIFNNSSPAEQFTTLEGIKEHQLLGPRQHLLEADQPKPSPPQVSPGAAPGGKAEPKLSGEFIQHSSGARVPREFYDLSPDAQKRFLASLEQKQEEAAAESRFDQVALRVLDEMDKLRKQVKGLESKIAEVASEKEAKTGGVASV